MSGGETVRPLAAVLFAALSWCQEPAPTPVEQASPPTAGTPTPAPTPAAPVVNVTVAPLAPPDLDSPYASPRDAARHRFQATLADLAASHNVREAMRGFGQAFLLDRTYAAAAFNLSVVSAIAEKWEDAASALEEAARLDPAGLGAMAAPQIERLQLLASLEKTSEGRRKRSYDEALLPLLDKLPKMPPHEATAALAELGKIDPRRWEAPALLAALNGDGHGYEASAKFLQIAAENASEPSIRSALEVALRAAERELRYASARAGADAAVARGEYPKAAELYEAAWTAIPARSASGLEAAATLLLTDDTARASALLSRLRQGPDGPAAERAMAMLKELEAIEPAAKAPATDAAKFYSDGGPAEPAKIGALVPPVDRKRLEIYSRPLPKLVDDPEPVVLLASISADSAGGAQPALPQLATPVIAGDNPWREITQLSPRPATEGAAAQQPQRSVWTVDMVGGGRTAHILAITSQPAGARVFIGKLTDPVCETPCNVNIATGTHPIRFSLPGFLDEERSVRVASATQELSVTLSAVRGTVLVETPSPAALKVNGTSVGAQSPAQLSLLPGLYRIGADFGTAASERLLTVSPGARLRIELHP